MVPLVQLTTTLLLVPSPTMLPTTPPPTAVPSCLGSAYPSCGAPSVEHAVSSSLQASSLGRSDARWGWLPLGHRAPCGALIKGIVEATLRWGELPAGAVEVISHRLMCCQLCLVVHHINFALLLLQPPFKSHSIDLPHKRSR
jgi:hypothetical protein